MGPLKQVRPSILVTVLFIKQKVAEHLVDKCPFRGLSLSWEGGEYVGECCWHVNVTERFQVNSNILNMAWRQVTTSCTLCPLKARSHIETQLNSTVELSWVSVSFDM